MVLLQKWPIFQLSFLANKGKENVFYDILHQKNAFLGYKNKNFEKSKNCIFLRGQRMVLVQKWPFFQRFFLGLMGQENAFYDILERKNAFLGYRNKNFKRSKHWHFSKGVNPRFGPKMAIFQTFFFRQ